MRYLLSLVSLGLLLASPLHADPLIDQLSFSELDCDWPVVASSPDGITMIAWVQDGDPMWGIEIVQTLRLPTAGPLPDPLPAPVSFGPGIRPALCWSREGFVLAMVSGGFVVAYQSDLDGYWNPEEFDVLSPGGESFGITLLDLWGCPTAAAGPHVFLTVGGALHEPTYHPMVLFASLGLSGWSTFDVVAEGLPLADLPQISWGLGPAGPVPRVYYLGDYEGMPGLVYTTRYPGEDWDGPFPVPGAGGMIPGPIGGEFDVARWGGEIALLGDGPQPTCPCNVIFHVGFSDPGGWSDPVNLTAVSGYEYDWPKSPSVAVDPDGRTHAFWSQKISDFMMEYRLTTLEYRVREDGVWTDEGDFLAGQDGPRVGGRVDMDLTPTGGQPVFAWTRRDTIAGEPQARAVWIARPEVLIDVPGDLTPRSPVALSVYPNPFNPRASVRFTLVRDQQVVLTVHDLAGRRVAVLARSRYPQGTHEVVWDGRFDGGREAPSGSYLVRIATSDEVRARKVSLIR